MTRLRFDRIGKTFPGVLALDDVSFDVHRGSIHALLGENGAGKSTLIKILAGAHSATAGRIYLDGRPIEIRNPHHAQTLGIAVVYQELTLVRELSVAENIRLGQWPSRGAGLIDRGALHDEARRALQRAGSGLSPAQIVGDLSVGQQQSVEIARALSFDARILVLDEPSAVLTPHELDTLFDVLRQLRDEGVAIIYISHRLEEIFALADRVTVLRDGRHISTRAVADVDHDGLVRDMVGRELKTRRSGNREAPRTGGGATEPVLEVRDLALKGALHDISFQVSAGEIFGLSGLVGAGRTALLRTLFGAVNRRSVRGLVQVGQSSGPFATPRDAIAAGVVLLPEDRKGEGLMLDRSVAENLTLASLGTLSSRGFVRADQERRQIERSIASLGIRTARLDNPVMNLSGGNQQKVVLGRWLDHAHRVVLFDEPTRGIDVGAKEEIYDWIFRLAESGAAVIVSSSELPEVLRLADRIGVMRRGRLVDILDNRSHAVNQETLLHMAAGTETAPV